MFNFVPSSCWLCEEYGLNNVVVDHLADFERTLEDLGADDLMKVVRAYLSRGFVACQKGFEKVTSEAKTSLDKQKMLEEENRRLKEENERLKRDASEQANHRAKQQEVLDALKRELELSVKCYEECRQELKDMVVQYDAQNILLEANANLIAELKKVKGELEDTLEKNEAYCHQWGAYLATEYRRALERFGAEAQDFKITDNISSFVEWLHSELKLLPDTMSKIGDYGAATCSEMLLNLLERQGCDHFKAFGSRGFAFPSPDDAPAPSKTVDLINKIILRNFWAKSGQAHARKKAVDRLAKVGLFGSFRLLPFLLNDCLRWLLMLTSFSQLHFGQAKQALELREHRATHGPDTTLGPYGPLGIGHRKQMMMPLSRQSPEPLFAKHLKTKAVRWIQSPERRWLPFGFELIKRCFGRELRVACRPLKHLKVEM
jgi:hypothetical protein